MGNIQNEKLKTTTLTLLFTLLCAQGAWAGLGDDEKAIQADMKSLNAQQVTATPGAQFTVQEMKLGGSTVREFVSPQGKVFGVAWRGRVHPDLTVLLSSHYDEYQTSATAVKKKGRAPLVIKNSDLHLERSGHMRDLRGRAVLMSLLPAGVDESVVR